MLVICLAIFTYLFNNSIRFDKAYFIHDLLNNKAYNAIVLIIWMQILHMKFVFISFDSSGKRVENV